MNNAKIIAKEIFRLDEAMKRTKSKYMKADYGKALKHRKAQLFKYCAENNLDATEVMRRAADD